LTRGQANAVELQVEPRVFLENLVSEEPSYIARGGHEVDDAGLERLGALCVRVRQMPTKVGKHSCGHRLQANVKRPLRHRLNSFKKRH